MNTRTRTVIQSRAVWGLVVAAGAISVAGISHAGGEKSWVQIENPYIRAYTDGSAAKVEPLVEELDRFRQAVLMVADWHIPADASPVEMLILKSGFRELTGSQWTGGLAVPLTPNPGPAAETILIMPMQGRRGVDEREVLRHEYVHALSRFRPMTFPLWYMEGIAELFAYTRVDGKTIIIDVPGDRIRNSDQARALGFDSWDSFDKVVERKEGGHDTSSFADYYLQSWLLTHYLTFGAPELAPQLEKCLLYSDAGMPPVKAFSLAFGMTPQEFWFDKLKHYTLQFSGRRFRLKTPIVAKPFLVKPIPKTVAEAKIESVRAQLEKQPEPK